VPAHKNPIVVLYLPTTVVGLVNAVDVDNLAATALASLYACAPSGKQAVLTNVAVAEQKGPLHRQRNRMIQPAREAPALSSGNLHSCRLRSGLLANGTAPVLSVGPESEHASSTEQSANDGSMCLLQHENVVMACDWSVAASRLPTTPGSPVSTIA
jgi:hypothetical protein